MKVVVSAIGRFHFFHLARQLKRHGHLMRFYTGYPIWKVDEDLRVDAQTFPWLNLSDFFLDRVGWQRARRIVNKLVYSTHDRWLQMVLPECDLLVSQTDCVLYTARSAKKRGAKVVLSRGSSHILNVDAILANEYARAGQSYAGYPRSSIERALEEYEEADLIAVPSTFAYNSYLDKGIPSRKLEIIPFGADLTMFKPVPKEDSIFRILYVGTMSLRKGVPYLMSALGHLTLPNFEIALIGGMTDEIRPTFTQYEGKYRYLGFIPRTQLAYHYSQASVLVFPTLEDGFGQVITQAMACGVPVIATFNSGAPDVITDGVEGYLVPAGDAGAIREKVLSLYENPEVRDHMAQAALLRVQSLGGWDDYGQRAVEAYQRLLSGKTSGQ